MSAFRQLDDEINRLLKQLPTSELAVLIETLLGELATRRDDPRVRVHVIAIPVKPRPKDWVAL